MNERRVLLTNWTMVGRHGSVMHIRDLALGLLRAGHRPIVYAPELGDVANELMHVTVPVVSELGRIGQPPAIRGQPFQLPIDTLGRLSDPEQFGAIVVKAGRGSTAEPATGIVRDGPVPPTAP